MKTKCDFQLQKYIPAARPGIRDCRGSPGIGSDESPKSKYGKRITSSVMSDQNPFMARVASAKFIFKKIGLKLPIFLTLASKSISKLKEIRHFQSNKIAMCLQI